MALKKTTYVSGSTIITAENLNDIQDSVIALENTERTSISGGAVTGGTNALVTKEVLDATSQLIMDEIPTALKNPYALTFTGAASGTYDGSSAVTINIPSGGSGTGGQGQDGKSVNWRGEYGASTTYNKLDAVSYNGSSYIYSSSTSASGKVPGIDTEWDLMAEKGQDGKPGATGPQGPAGEPGKGGEPGIVISSTQPTGDTHPVWLNPDGDADGEDFSLGISSATVGQIAKITAVDGNGVPTAWEPVDMPSGSGGHWETVLDTVWEQDVIHPTAYNSETGIFTCAEGELNNLELNKEYAFFQQCAVEGAAFNTILNNDQLKVTKLSETTFSTDVTPPTTFVPANVKFSRGACLAITDIDAKKIRLTLDGRFKPTATLYDNPFCGMNVPYFGRNTSYTQIRTAYNAYQQVTAEVESPYRIVGKILCGFNAPSNNKNFHFKNNSFCCPLVPYDVPEGSKRTYLLTSDGTKIEKLYSTSTPWLLGGGNENNAILSDYLKIISGTKVKLERWVE